MNSDQLTRQAIRLAQRQSARCGRTLTRDEVLRLRVQAVSPWTRGILVIAGLGVVVGTNFCHKAGAPWWFLTMFGAAGLLLAVLGAFGRREYLDREMKKLKGEAPVRVLDAILNALM